MGGLLGDLENLWNAVENTGATVFHDLEDAVNHLTTLGVPLFPSLKDFIQFLVTEGENPFTFIPNLIGHITSRNGNVVETLEELASGFIHEGPQNYTSRQTSRFVNVITNAVQQHTQTASSLGALHQSTITQIQNKLLTLSQGSPGAIPFQGDAALTIQSNFTTISQNMNTLTAPMNSSSPGDPTAAFQDNVASINQGFIDGLNEIPTMVRQFGMFDLAAISVALIIGGVLLVTTAGTGDIIEVPIAVVVGVVLVLVEALVVAVWFLGDCLIWAIRMLAALIVLGIEEIFYHPQTTSTTTSSTTAGATHHTLITSAPTLPNPELTPEGEALVNDLLNEFGGTIPKEMLQYLVKVLGASKLSAAMIRCLYQNGYLDLSSYSGNNPMLTDANNNAWVNINDHIDPNDLEGAWKDQNPDQVDPTTIKDPQYVSGADHYGEVSDALNSITRLISNLTNVIRGYNARITYAPDPNAPDILDLIQKRDHLQKLLDTWTKVRDFIRSKIAKGSPSPDTWPDKGKLPLVDELLQVSTCNVPGPQYYK
ncbi:MAG TPA: hypothetical protein VFV38_37305 [Ktedonobacteraceae bacterium]|nr:hypothetical protein [Ktedonobacteraceae bacterium]